MKFVLVKPSKFLMGSPLDEAGRGRGDDERQHEVTLTKAFYLGVYQVTQRQWKDVMDNNPAYFSADGEGKEAVDGLDTDDFPVEQVSWLDVQEFLQKLAALAGEKGTGREYRLPSEAEWEYACRGGHLIADLGEA